MAGMDTIHADAEFFLGKMLLGESAAAQVYCGLKNLAAVLGKSFAMPFVGAGLGGIKPPAWDDVKADSALESAG